MLSEAEILEARAVLERATPFYDEKGTAYYQYGTPFTDVSTGKTRHRFVEYDPEKFIEFCRSLLPRALGEIERLRKENAKLREALEWYADENNWGDPNSINYDGGEISVDVGERARAALDGGKDE